MKFIITVDTEADNQWKHDEEISIKNIEFLPRFQALCDKYSFIPTYLVTYEVAQSKTAIKMLSDWQKDGKVEVGAHLHPWTNPPFIEKTKEDIYPSELSEQELEAKISTLTEVINQNFGNRPTSYRAGRWGFDARQINILLKLGYLVDCSVTPKVSWRGNLGKLNGLGGPDFRFTSVKPYYLSQNNVCQPGGSALLEVPMTILFTGPLNKEDSALAEKFILMPNNFFKKILNKLFFKQKWLRIFDYSAKKDWQRIYISAKRNNLPVIEFMIHSSELMPGGSPYTKDKKDIEFIYYQIEEVFNYFKKQEIQGISLGEFAKNYKHNIGAA